MSTEVVPGNMGSRLPEMSLREFLDEGYLQEVNRRFFHPLGLALSVKVDDDGHVSLHNIWDGRDDPEGFTFEGWTPADQVRGEVIEARLQHGLTVRQEHLGFGIQPLEGTRA